MGKTRVQVDIDKGVAQAKRLDAALPPAVPPGAGLPARIELADIAAPIFDAAMASRLRLARRNHCKKHWRNSKNLPPTWIYETCSCVRQEDLAQQLGVSHDMVSRVEKGLLIILPVTVRRFRSALGRLSEYVLFGRGAEEYEGFQHRRLAHRRR